MLEKLKTLFSKRYKSSDNQVLKAKILQDIENLDEDLLQSLLKDESIKEQFFKKVKDVLVFDKYAFESFVNLKEFLPDSFTKFSNKIGLSDNNGFLIKNNDVVLSFPYKDCYLEGGQSKKDEKRKEIFYHEILAYDKISNMLEPKVLTKAKRYLTGGGIETNIKIKNNDNLIIKGNNLLALTSILKRYENKVKLIYIDPPYNTGSDEFEYNDSFNHSTWLTFMKNRLEIAKRLLRDDGVIFVQCDDNEQAYLKVLMDEIFGRDNFISSLVWRKIEENTSTGGTMKITKTYRKDHEYIVCFSNVKKIFLTKKYMELPNFLNEYKNLDNDPRGAFKAGSISMKGNKNSYKYYAITTPSGKVYERVWRITKEEFDKLDKDNRIYYGKKLDAVPQLKIFINEERPVTPTTIFENLGSSFTASEELQKLFQNKNENIFSNPKPEELLKRILETATNENDIILDFFLGSGTTAAVAHKMNRRYIGIEQMDYLEDIAVQRLIKVLDGEQSGISKSVNWQGGGSFVYCELMQNSLEIMDEVLKANDKNIDDISQKVFNDERIIPFISKDELKKITEDFDNLSLEEKRKRLIKIIDFNKLYVNYSSIDDESFNVSDTDKEFNKSFYEKDLK